MVARALALVVIVAACLMAWPLYTLHEGMLATKQQDIDARAHAMAYKISDVLSFLSQTARQIAASEVVRGLLISGGAADREKWSINSRELLPDVLGLGLFDASGALLGSKEELHVGEVCIEDARLFAKDKLLRYPPIHKPLFGVGHFDTFSKIADRDGKHLGLLYVSYTTSVVQRIFDRYAQMGYSYEIRNKAGDLIARYGDETFPYQLPINIPDTDWILVVGTDNALSSEELRPLQFSIVMLMLVLVLFLITVGPFITRRIVDDIAKVKTLLMYKNLDSEAKPSEESNVRLAEIASLLEDIDQLSGEITQTRSQLELQAYSDELTGLMNRRAFEVSRGHLSRLAARQPVILALIDIDHFKEINDTYGHAAGDFVLKKFGELLKSSVRSSDEVYRLGGDELLVVFTSDDISYLQKWYDNISEKLSTMVESQGVDASFSAGATQLSPGSDEVFRDAMMKADAALYRAKKTGRSRIVLG